jgi:uncharacterized protein
MAPGDVFHEGELAVQRRAGTLAEAARIGVKMVEPAVPAKMAAFLAARPFVVLGGAGADGRVWAAPLFGGEGFVRVAQEGRELLLATRPAAEDPLVRAIAAGPLRVGMTAIEPDTRERVRVNGIARLVRDGVALEVLEAFINCPKYIQRRVPAPTDAASHATGAAQSAGRGLDAAQAALVRAADTFFLASRHPRRGADVSHRGGRPGFVAVASPERMVFPDYAGNKMFQSLGNLSVDPAVGLLFVDWESGATLQVSGRAEVVWDGPRVAAWPGAERVLEIAVEAVVGRAAGFPGGWKLVEAHRPNPPLPGAQTG